MNDCIYYILSFLNDKDLFVCFHVNHLFNKISHDNLLWQKHCHWIQCDHNFYHHFKIGFVLHRFLSRYITCQQPFNTLHKIDLFSEKLTSLPPELGQCAALQTLDLSHNQLTSLPPALGQCAALQGLYLNSNQLTSIPSKLGQCATLQVLYLNHNQLTSIPPTLGQCAALQVLYLNHNQLTSIPPELERVAIL